MKQNAAFLAVLWSFVAISFVLFQNFTQDGSAATVHNDVCKQTSDLNQSRILNASNLGEQIISNWPRSASSDPTPMLKAMTSLLMDANTKIYQACLSNASVTSSQTVALEQLKKLADSDDPGPWKNYVNTLESAINTLNGASN